jgi:hypothetical protein
MPLSKTHLKPTLNGAPLIYYTVLCYYRIGKKFPSYWAQSL